MLVLSHQYTNNIINKNFKFRSKSYRTCKTRKNESLLRNNEKLKLEKTKIRKSSIKGTSDSKYSLLYTGSGNDSQNNSFFSKGNIFKSVNTGGNDADTSITSNQSSHRYTPGGNYFRNKMSKMLSENDENNTSKNSDLDKSGNFSNKSVTSLTRNSGIPKPIRFKPERYADKDKDEDNKDE